MTVEKIKAKRSAVRQDLFNCRTDTETKCVRSENVFSEQVFLIATAWERERKCIREVFR